MTTPYGEGVNNTSDAPWSIGNYFATGDDGSIPGLLNRTQPNIIALLQTFLQSNPAFTLASDLVFAGLRAGISLPLAIIEAIVNRLFGFNIEFEDLGSVLDAIEQVPGVSQVIDVIHTITGVDLSTVFDGIDLTDPGALLTAMQGIAQTIVTTLVQEIIDLIFNNLNPALSNATNVPLALLAQSIQLLVNSINTATASATNAFDVAQSFGALLHQAVDVLDDLPFYEGPADFLANIQTIVGTLLGSVFQSLTPANPSVASSNAQINALWAAINPSSSVTGIRYVFDTNVALAGKWTAPVGFSLPGMIAANGTAGVSNSLGTTAAVYSDATLMSDRFEGSMVIEDLSNNGSSAFFLSGHLVGSTLGQHVGLLYEHEGYGDFLSICTYTGVNAGGTQRAAIQTGTTGPPTNIPALKVNDVLGLQYDGPIADGGTNTWAMFVNGLAVGPTWTDTGLVVTHGVGYRECGVVCNYNNFGFAPGPVLGLFVVNDY